MKSVQLNLSTQPMYLKNVSAELDRRTAHFYQHDPLNTQDSLRRLEPGEAATYTVGWQFAEQSLRNPDKQKVVVQVETTKKAFSQDVQINPVIVTAELPLFGRTFGQLHQYKCNQRERIVTSLRLLPALANCNYLTGIKSPC